MIGKVNRCIPIWRTREELQPAHPGHRCVYIDQIPKLCSPLSPLPGKVCGKSIEVHCSGKRFVWGADPLYTGQKAGSIFRRRGQEWDEGCEGCLGEAGRGGGHGDTLEHCPEVPYMLSAVVRVRSMPSGRIVWRWTSTVTQNTNPVFFFLVYFQAPLCL